MDIKADAIKKLLENLKNGIIAVGTTSLRTIESLYWMGVKTILYPLYEIADLAVRQWDVYEAPLADSAITATASLTGLLNWMQKKNLGRIITTTQLLITPGYSFKLPIALITNFHQPQSTLLLLVAAAIGDDWRKVYAYAMENDFRFLSYGDGSLLFLPEP